MIRICVLILALLFFQDPAASAAPRSKKAGTVRRPVVIRPIIPAPTPAPTPALEWRGRIYTDQYWFTAGNRPGEFEQSSVSAWLDVSSELSSQSGFRGVVQLDAFYRDINHPDSSSARVRVREAYYSYLGDGIEFRIGQQIIPWGRSDGVNPTDYFTAKDMTLLNPDDEVRRLGAPGFNFSYTPRGGASPFTMQLVFQAAYPQMRMLIPDQSIPPGIVFEKTAPAPDWFRSDSMEAGVKLSYQQPSFDLSISAFRGRSQYAQYLFDLPSASIRAVHPGETAVGADGSFTWDAQVFRFETALRMPDNGTREDPNFGLVQPWHWDSVIGVERPLGDEFRIQAQFLYRWHLYYPEAMTFLPVQVAVGNANALILNYQDQGNPGGTLRLAWQKDGSNFTADVFMVGYFASGESFLIRPQVGYTPFTNMKLITGADLYGGNPDRPLGALRSRSHLFFEAKYVF